MLDLSHMQGVQIDVCIDQDPPWFRYSVGSPKKKSNSARLEHLARCRADKALRRAATAEASPAVIPALTCGRVALVGAGLGSVGVRLPGVDSSSSEACECRLGSVAIVGHHVVVASGVMLMRFLVLI